MVKEGAHIIDIGAESTNPNSKFVDEKEELEVITCSTYSTSKRN